MARKKSQLAAVSPQLSPHDRLLQAADELFYENGVRSVGIDRVIERAGVAKASLYTSFGSKDELVRAYLKARHQRRKQRIASKLMTCTTPREQILGIFDLLAELFSENQLRGCAFVRASAEEHSEDVTAVCDETRTWLRDLFTELARNLGARKPEQLSAQLVLQYDGAIVGAQMDRDPLRAQTAREVAAVLIERATMD